MGWTIDKEMSFDYGHRVHNQTLNTEYSIDDACVCRHLHGHRGKVHIYLESTTLNETGMVTDFKHLNWLKKFLDEIVDHKFIIHDADPLYDKLVGGDTELIPIVVPGTAHVVGFKPDMSDWIKGTPEYEYYEGLVIVHFIPTSEYLSKWLFEIAHTKMQDLGVKVSRVDWWETPKSKSTYTG